MYHIYVVDDDLTVQRELKVLLENQGYRTTIAQKFTSIPEEIEDVKPDLILLDISLPSVDGIMLCAQIRMLSEVPIIFVTSQNSSAAELECMLSGGDDFIEKPYRPAVLLAHISAVLRRTTKRSENILSFEDLELDVVAAKLKHYQNVVELSKNELLICFLLSNDCSRRYEKLRIFCSFSVKCFVHLKWLLNTAPCLLLLCIVHKKFFHFSRKKYDYNS